MRIFFIAITVLVILTNIPLLIMLLKKKSSFYDKFAAITGISTSTILFLLLIGYATGREDLYIDIAISYAILSFLSSIIAAKFIAARKEKKDDC